MRVASRFSMTASSSLFVFLAIAFSSGCASKDPAAVVVKEAADTQTVEPEVGAPEAIVPDYPDGPYGIEKGKVFPPIEMEGYKGGQGGTWAKFSMKDYYDVDGKKGVYAILFVVSAEWCVPCQQEAKKLTEFFADPYKKQGAAFIGGMIQNYKHEPADQKTVDRWIAKFHTNFDIGIGNDLDSQTLPATAGIPRNYIIDPRNMVIYRVNSGEDPNATNVPGLKYILLHNKAPNLDPPAVADSGTGVVDTGVAIPDADAGSSTSDADPSTKD
ncbi:MAG: hypothetical protein NVSMB1_01740 [Polyangiales bacterium]